MTHTTRDQVGNGQVSVNGTADLLAQANHEVITTYICSHGKAGIGHRHCESAVPMGWAEQLKQSGGQSTKL